MEQILVTGGTGFIGSHASIALLERGFRVLVIDSCVNSSPKTIDRIKKVVSIKNKNLENNLVFYKGDLCDINFLEKIFDDADKEGNDISYVMHFAGLKSVGDSNLRPFKYWNSNLLGTLNLLMMMDKFNCKNLIFSSSASVYGDDKQIYKEDSAINPRSPYGNTKAAIEKLLFDIYNSSPNNWRIACLRYFNPLGAHQSALIGEDPIGTPNNIFPLINKVATGSLEKILIYGNDYDTKDGTGIRDYIHVMDLAIGHLKTMEYMKRRNPQYLILNIGTGKGTSVLELIRTYEKINNVEISFSFTKRRKGDLPLTIADNSFMKSILDWEPKISLEEMCRDGLRWELNKNEFVIK